MGQTARRSNMPQFTRHDGWPLPFPKLPPPFRAALGSSALARGSDLLAFGRVAIKTLAPIKRPLPLLLELLPLGLRLLGEKPCSCEPRPLPRAPRTKLDWPPPRESPRPPLAPQGPCPPEWVCRAAAGSIGLCAAPAAAAPSAAITTNQIRKRSSRWTGALHPRGQQGHIRTTRYLKRRRTANLPADHHIRP
eukprot:626972-Pyramimonas_sp.AAC.1